MIKRINGLFLRSLYWLADIPAEPIDADKFKNPQEQAAADMEAAKRRIQNAQRRIELVQMSVDVITRRKH